ncbi:MAG: DEAD/DEAH box helicase [Verrucomicrobiota bacterium]
MKHDKSMPSPPSFPPSKPSGKSGEVLFYELGLRGERELCCRLLFPGDAKSRGASLSSKRRLEKLLQQPFLTAKDRKILMGFYMGANPAQREIRVKGSHGHRLVMDMLESGRCVWEGSQRPLQWGEDALGAGLCWKVTATTWQEPGVELSEGAEADILPLQPVLAHDRHRGLLCPLDFGDAIPPELGARWVAAGPLGKEQVGAFLSELLEEFPEAEVPAPESLLRGKMRDVRPHPVLDLHPCEFLDREGNRPPFRGHAGRVGFDYLGVVLGYGGLREFAPIVVGGELVEMERDRGRETSEWDFLLDLGGDTAARLLPEHEVDEREGWVLPREGGLWESFLAEHWETLRERGWEVRFEGRSALQLAQGLDSYVRVQSVAHRAGWFEFETGVMVGEEQVNLLPLIHDLLRRYAERSRSDFRAEVGGQTFFVPTVAGVVHAFPGTFFVAIVERVFELYDEQPFVEGDRLHLSGLRAMELAEQFGAAQGVEGVPESIQRAARVLREGMHIEPASEPEGLRATLRDYQRFGLGWLQFMATHELNGVLADDMGLGKTLQTIAHLAAEKEAGRLEEAALLVAPTSLLRNWQREVERFAPHLSVLVLQGEGRKTQFRAISSADLVVTTYGLIRRDEEWHRDQHYSWIILDEAQFIKNPESKVTQVLGTIPCDRRLCLTGTPVENHLGELWSLFHFLMPGFLGEKEAFRKQFRIPIEEEGNEAMRDVLHRRVRPFLLRRKKNEVATELPPKTEIEHPVEMTSRQVEVYESLRVAMNTKVMKEIAEKGLARAQIVILDALTKLRQICCDPRLAKIPGEELHRTDSAKLMELMEFLPEMLGEGRRVLLFSQFTSMLKLIGEELDRAKMEWVTLTGATKDRAKCVDAFQSRKVPIFLISLRAGGTGLNLTEADTVIHYDPWWNPQVENQATDRAYRIGQEKPVFVYKMIAENSVEEKILAMQRKKAVLAEGVLSNTGHAGKVDFGEEDVAALLQ